jgi:hypothetical protein
LSLVIGDPADHRSDYENRDQHQWQNDHGHLPADLEIVEVFRQVTAPYRISAYSETWRLCCL